VQSEGDSQLTRMQIQHSIHWKVSKHHLWCSVFSFPKLG
jgi:hypothetical protein